MKLYEFLTEEPKFSEEDIALGGTIIYARDGQYRMSKAVSKRALTVTVMNGDVVPMRLIVSTDASDWTRFRDKKYTASYDSYWRP